MAKKVTMQQIADYLGLSKFVVSRALSGKEGVNSSTKDKVFEAAAKLGYFAQKNKKINTFPEGVVSSKSNVDHKSNNQMVLILMPNIRYQTKDSSYWGKIVDGISNSLEALGVGMFVMTESNVTSLSNTLKPERFMGAIGVGVISASILLEIDRMNLPLVLIDYEDPLLPCDTIFNNNFDGSFHLTNYLIGLGHKNVQFIGDIYYSRSFYDRWLGYRSAMEENNLVTVEKRKLENINVINVEGEFEAWLTKEGKDMLPTALVCANDNIALRAISVLKKNKFIVPDDISVVGFDNKEVAYQMSPTLTTVNIAKTTLGKRAVEMLFRRIREKNSPFEKLMLAGTIMLRESTAQLSE